MLLQLGDLGGDRRHPSGERNIGSSLFPPEENTTQKTSFGHISTQHSQSYDKF